MDRREVLPQVRAHWLTLILAAVDIREFVNYGI
jgi:hypothetical protein